MSRYGHLCAINFYSIFIVEKSFETFLNLDKNSKIWYILQIVLIFDDELNFVLFQMSYKNNSEKYLAISFLNMEIPQKTGNIVEVHNTNTFYY